jgi:hypothetical protein
MQPKIFAGNLVSKGNLTETQQASGNFPKEQVAW